MSSRRGPSPPPRKALLRAASVLAALALTALAAAPAGATTFCVPDFDPGRCPEGGGNVAEESLETAMQEEGFDGVADTVVVAPGTFTDTGSLSPAGTDPLTVEGAGAGGAADPTATRLTSSSSGNIIVVNLAAASRAITMRDLTVVVPGSLTDNGGSGFQVGGDTLERVDIEIANPGSDGISSWPGGGTYRGGTIYPAGGGTVTQAIASGNCCTPGQISVKGVTMVEPLYGIWGQDEAVPIMVERTAIVHPGGTGVFASDGGQVRVANSVVLIDGAASALEAKSFGADDPSIDAENVTLVQEGAGLGSGVASRSQSTGEATVEVESSIVRGFSYAYYRLGSGGDADLTIRHSNFEQAGVDSGTGTLDIGTGNIDADPLFAAAPPYGAPADLTLRPGSPSIDAGDPAPAGAPVDFLGAPRPLDGDGDGAAVRDQGAFEAPVPQPPEPPAQPAPGPAPPAVLVPTVDTTVEVSVLGKRTRVDRRGVARVRLHCPAAEQSPPCRGRVVLRTRARLLFGRGAKTRRRGVVLARAGFTISAGKVKAVRLRVPGRKLGLLYRSRGPMRVVVIVRARDGSGNRGYARPTMWLAAGRWSVDSTFRTLIAKSRRKTHRSHIALRGGGRKQVHGSPRISVHKPCRRSG